MPAIAPPPEPVVIMACLEGKTYATQEYAEGREGRLVFGNRQAVYRAWHDRSEYLTRQKEERSDELPEQNDLLDELPPVVQFPILRTVKMRFRYVGRHQPLPFPDTDD